MSRHLLQIQNLSKTFPGQKALDDVSFDISAGEVHALVGHNGSGKSTLIKILAGFYTADHGGSAIIDGQSIRLDRHRPADPRMHFVHQGLGLVENLNAVDNIALGAGYVRRAFGTINWSGQAALARATLERIGVELDIWCSVSLLAPVERTAIAIARALRDWEGGTGLLVLDEPTAALPPREVDRLFEIIDELRQRGFAIVYVSHRLDEILRVADTLTVLRGGRHIGTRPTAGLDRKTLIELMVGEDVPEVPHVPTSLESRDRVMEVRDLRTREIRGLSLDVHAGEVLGVAGLLGSGREELPYALFGTLRAEGRVMMHGREIARRTPRVLRDIGVGLVPADRARQAAIAQFDIRENMSLASLHAHRSHLFVDRGSEHAFAARWAEDLDVQPRRLSRSIQTLSGGNQQKVILARWLGRNPDLLILDEPTAGVDISTRSVIYDLIRRRSAKGTSFVICTSDVEDLVAVCDRVLVLQAGAITDEFSGDEITEPRILTAMLGASESATAAL